MKYNLQVFKSSTITVYYKCSVYCSESFPGMSICFQYTSPYVILAEGSMSHYKTEKLQKRDLYMCMTALYTINMTK